MKLNFKSLKGKLFVAAFLCLIIVLSISANSLTTKAAAQKTLYVVVNVAVQPPSEGAYLSGSNDVNPAMDVNMFSPTSESSVTQVFDPSFRNSKVDNFGGTVKLTWQCEMDYLMAQSSFSIANGSAGVQGYTAMYDLMNKYWGTQIQNFGDQLAYNHLFEVYGTQWTSYTNGPDAGYPNYQNIALSHMIIDDNFFPNTFWSHFFPDNEPIAASNWVEQYIPFDYAPTYGSTSPIQLYAGMNHLQIQTLGYYDYYNLLEAFNNAVTRGSSIYSIYLPAYANIAGNISAIQNDCVADTNGIAFPGVSFKYVTAAQAMKLFEGYTDTTPPTFTVARNASTYIISSSETLWNNAPYVALQYSNGLYTNIAATLVGTNVWTVTVPNSGSLVKVGVAASDLYGNPGLLSFTPQSPPTANIPSSPTLSPSAPPEVQVPVHGITATSQYLTYNAGQAIDGIESSTNFWASDASIDLPSSITLDLWNLTPINQISTHFYDIDTRTYTYNVGVSTDGSTWTPVIAPKTASGVVNDSFAQTMTRFVRMTVTYGSANNVANIEEIKIYQQTLLPTPTPSPTPTASPTPTPSPTPSPTPTATPTPTLTPTQTTTPTPKSSSTPTPTPTLTSSPTPTSTPLSTNSESLPTAIVYSAAAVIITIIVAVTVLLFKKYSK